MVSEAFMREAFTQVAFMLVAFMRVAIVLAAFMQEDFMLVACELVELARTTWEDTERSTIILPLGTIIRLLVPPHTVPLRVPHMALRTTHMPIRTTIRTATPTEIEHGVDSTV